MKLRQLITGIVLFVILLQGANRTGLLNYLYMQRHSIMYVLHLSGEKVISECGSRYLAEGDLRILTSDDEQKVPQGFSITAGINLFPPSAPLALSQLAGAVVPVGDTAYRPRAYPPATTAVFRPPLAFSC